MDVRGGGGGYRDGLVVLVREVVQRGERGCEDGDAEEREERELERVSEYHPSHTRGPWACTCSKRLPVFLETVASTLYSTELELVHLTGNSTLPGLVASMYHNVTAYRAL